MVNGQVHPVGVGLGVLGEEVRGGDVRGDHPLRLEALRGGVGQEVGGRGVRQLRVGEQVGRFPLSTETGAEGGGGAHGVPVGPEVGEDENVVKGPQQGGDFGDGGHGHSSSSVRGPRAASFSSSLRRSSKMWAPCWMESSPTKRSSGV